MNILVPFDFSKFSVKALTYALAYAQKLNASVELIHVIELPVISDPLAVSAFNFDDSLKADLTRNITMEFNKVIGKTQGANVKIKTTQLFGPVARTIVQYAHAAKSDIIIIGDHGASVFSEFFMGSNAMKIVRAASVPVIVIKDQAYRDIRSIVFPHSLKIEGQESLVREIIRLQKKFNAHLHIVSVNSPMSFTSEEASQEKLEHFLAHFKPENYTSKIYKDEDFAGGIASYAKSVDADLIMMATQGRTGLSHLLNTSLAEEVIHQSEIPVWTSSLSHVPVMAV